MSVLWRESPEDAWKRETRRVGSQRARAVVVAALSYALSLPVAAVSWELFVSWIGALALTTHGRSLCAEDEVGASAHGAPRPKCARTPRPISHVSG